MRIYRPGDPPDVVRVALEDEEQLPGIGVPDSRGVVLAARDYELPVRAERNRVHVGGAGTRRRGTRIVP